jgi:ribosomal protein S14
VPAKASVAMDTLTGGDLSDLPLILLSLALAVVFGLMTALVARAKGRSFALWLIYGVFAPPFALFRAMLMSPNTAGKKILSSEARRRCPHCGEAIGRDLEVCPQCWRVLPTKGAPPEEG